MTEFMSGHEWSTVKTPNIRTRRDRANNTCRRSATTAGLVVDPLDLRTSLQSELRRQLDKWGKRPNRLRCVLIFNVLCGQPGSVIGKVQ